MKSDRRHDLQTNYLADRLGDRITALQPYLPAIAGAIVLVAIGSLAWGFMNSAAKRKSSDAWTEFYLALPDLGLTDESQDTTIETDLFDGVAKSFPGTDAGAWANRTAGAGFLARGLREIYLNKAEGESLLEEAIERFSLAIEADPDDSLKSVCNYGLGQAHEALGKLDDAAKYYEDVLDADPAEGLRAVVEERLAFIKSEKGKEFYAWFVKLDPKPDAPINLPSEFSMPPVTPDLQFTPDATNTPPLPSADEMKLPPAGDAEPPATGVELPADGGSEGTASSEAAGTEAATTPEGNEATESAPAAEAESAKENAVGSEESSTEEATESGDQ